MKILRSLYYRSSSILPAGYFTVLQSPRWSAASRMEREFHPGHCQSTVQTFEKAGFPSAPSQDGKWGTAIHLRFVDPDKCDRQLLRPVLSILGAIAITLGFLLWVTKAH
ncbi:MAG: hypothetical protein WCA21_19855 [Terracidiphilus sp.]